MADQYGKLDTEISKLQDLDRDSDALVVSLAFSVKSLSRLNTRARGIKAKCSDSFKETHAKEMMGYEQKFIDIGGTLVAIRVQCTWAAFTLPIRFLTAILQRKPTSIVALQRAQD